MPVGTDIIEPMATQIDQQQLADQLVAQAREEGMRHVGEGGLLTGLTKAVVKTAPKEELSDHLGYDKDDPAGRNGGYSRHGYRAKTVLTEIGPVEIEVPRDGDSSFEPVIVGSRQRRLNGPARLKPRRRTEQGLISVVLRPIRWAALPGGWMNTWSPW